VIVRDGRVIGEGYHHRFGGPHAEIDALRHCTASAERATVYVTLEPCCHYGKTPPCTDTLIAAGVTRVVAPLEDPNPRVAGHGFALLRNAGIRVDTGLLRSEAAELNAPFLKFMRQRRPWVIVKWAQSLDGKIATRTGDSKWISDETCRAHAHCTRGRVDAILVGIGTVLRDDPLLTSRVGRPKRVATRVVLDTHLRIPLRARLVRTARDTPTWVVCCRGAATRRVRALEKAGCLVHFVPKGRGGVSLKAVLDLLGQNNAANVLAEGGGTLLGELLDQHFADEIHVYIAPLLIGGRHALGPLHGRGVATVARALRLLRTASPRRLGSGYFVAARVGSPPSA
jgi:diaminohydroxyphosphoribosylaminopyrimidine deaminase/5-amino-6-(5-phosphoribosylamino)uracil reductase